MIVSTTYHLTAHPQDGRRRFVHLETCQIHRWHVGETLELGEFDAAQDALAAARRRDPEANACAFCCPDAHVPDHEIRTG